MSRHRWTKWVFLSGLVIFGLWFGFAFAARVLGVVIAGVEPEAWVADGDDDGTVGNSRGGGTDCMLPPRRRGCSGRDDPGS